MAASDAELLDIKERRQRRERPSTAPPPPGLGAALALSNFLAAPTGVLATTALIAGIAILSRWDAKRQEGGRMMGAPAAPESVSETRASAFASAPRPRPAESGPGPALGGSGLDEGGPLETPKPWRPEPAQEPDRPQGPAGTPWRGLIQPAMGLLAAGALLLMIASQLNLTAAARAARGLALAAAASGAASAAIGALLLARYGQWVQGNLFAGCGILLVALAALVAASAPPADDRDG